MPEVFSFNSKQIADVLQRNIREYKTEVGVEEVGEVIEAGDGIARVFGLEDAEYGELVRFKHNVFGMVLNLNRA